MIHVGESAKPQRNSASNGIAKPQRPCQRRSDSSPIKPQRFCACATSRIQLGAEVLFREGLRLQVAEVFRRAGRCTRGHAAHGETRIGRRRRRRFQTAVSAPGARSGCDGHRPAAQGCGAVRGAFAAKAPAARLVHPLRPVGHPAELTIGSPGVRAAGRVIPPRWRGPAG